MMDIKLPKDTQELLFSKHLVQKDFWGGGRYFKHSAKQFLKLCWSNNAKKVKYGQVGITVLKHTIHIYPDSIYPKRWAGEA